MIITCGQCQAKFKVAPEQIKETGSKVRCSNCQYVFTVYRPKRPAETVPPALDDFAGSGLNDYSPSPASGSERAGGVRPDDFYGGRDDDHGRSDFSDGDYDEDDYLDDDRPADDSASMRERRDRRRHLYSDLEGAADDSGFDDDPLDDVYDDDSEIDDDHGGIPPLRRNRARVSSMAAEPESEDYSDYDEDDFEESPDEFDPEEIRDTPAASRSDLGLGADPADHGSADAGSKPDPFARLAAGYHADEGRRLGAAAKKKSKLLIALGLIALLLGVAIFFVTSRPKETALISGDDPETVTNGEEQSPATAPDVPRSPDDPNGTNRIVFIDGKQNHFYFKNNHAGNILVLTGQVRNSYDEPRSFIRLRGYLMTSDETKILAERFAYAGNMLSEAELTELPVNEITTRLGIKGGKDNVNVNVPPEGEIPFMIVFADIPDGTEQYRIDPVGSDPAQ